MLSMEMGQDVACQVVLVRSGELSMLIEFLHNLSLCPEAGRQHLLRRRSDRTSFPLGSKRLIA